MSATSPAPSRAKDDPPRGRVPAFSEAPQDLPGATEPTPEATAEPVSSPPATPSRWPAAVGNLRERARAALSGSDSPPATRTETSSDGTTNTRSVSVVEATTLVVGLLGLVGVVAGAAVRWRTGRRGRLREPTDAQAQRIAEPLARILRRRADLSLLGEDVPDLIKAVAATGAYVGDGPLILPAVIDDGVPHDLETES